MRKSLKGMRSRWFPRDMNNRVIRENLFVLVRAMTTQVNKNIEPMVSVV